VPVDPGAHRVRAWGPGLGQWSTEVSVTSEGAVHEVTVPASEDPSFFDPLHRKLGLAAAGVGVVGVSVGTFFGMRAIAKKNEANRTGCNGASCDDAESADLREQARSAGDAATLAMSLGAAGLASAAVLFWVVSDSDAESPEPNDHATAMKLHPALATSGGGLWLRGEF
jgi:nitrate/nitrite transporter NarK